MPDPTFAKGERDEVALRILLSLVAGGSKETFDNTRIEKLAHDSFDIAIAYLKERANFY